MTIAMTMPPLSTTKMTEERGDEIVVITIRPSYSNHSKYQAHMEDSTYSNHTLRYVQHAVVDVVGIII
jgi:hypothetical protein